MNTCVILSTTLLVGDGCFKSRALSLEEARAWVEAHNPTNFVGHSTVRVLGLEPATLREQCLGYTEALCLAARGRLEFGREYTVEEILEIGVDFRLITRVGGSEYEAGYASGYHFGYGEGYDAGVAAAKGW